MLPSAFSSGVPRRPHEGHQTPARWGAETRWSRTRRGGARLAMATRSGPRRRWKQGASVQRPDPSGLDANAGDLVLQTSGFQREVGVFLVMERAFVRPGRALRRAERGFVRPGGALAVPET